MYNRSIIWWQQGVVFLLISFSHFSMLLMWNLLAIKSQTPIVKKYMHTQRG